MVIPPNTIQDSSSSRLTSEASQSNSIYGVFGLPVWNKIFKLKLTDFLKISYNFCWLLREKTKKNKKQKQAQTQKTEIEFLGSNRIAKQIHIYC